MYIFCTVFFLFFSSRAAWSEVLRLMSATFRHELLRAVFCNPEEYGMQPENLHIFSC